MRPPQAAEVAVAEVDGVNYNDIQKAFDAVKQSNGGTLKLLANCETPNTNQQFDISGNYTLNLNGCTLKGQLELKTKESNLTIQDSKGGGKLQAPGDWDTLSVKAGSATIKSGTLASSSKGSPISFGDEEDCDTLTIEGGSFETGYVYIGYSGGKTVISGGDFHELRVHGDATLSGGTFDTVKRYESGGTIAPADLLKDGYVFVNRDTSAEVSASQAAALTNVKVVSEKTANASASLTVDGTEAPYRTFEEALTAAQQKQGGTLSLLADVNLAKQVNVNSGTFTLDLNGHTLTSGALNTLVVGDGSVTIKDSKGGGVISNTSSDNIAVYCYVGNVTILGGSFPSKLYWESGTVSLQGGAFRFLDSKGGSWLSAIPEGKALKKNGDSVVDASAKTIHTATGFYVLADHEHDWQAGKCACGREHTDHTWKDGKCTVCHLTCSHGTIGGDGVCKTCGTQFAVKANRTYYKYLSDALASENVDDVTLLADDTLSADVRLERDIMFFPNGHTVSGGGSIVVPSGKRLTFHGNENGETGNAGAIRVEDGGTLRVDEDFTGTVQTLTVSETADIKLSGGTYGTITGSRQKAGTLLNYNTVTGEKYFAFQKQDGTFARYNQRISSETPLENVTVVGCPDKGLTEACGETCEYCDGALRCRIGASGYRDMSDDAIRDVPDGGTITLLRDYSAVYNISANVDRAYTIDLNGHSVRKDSGGISLVVFAGTPKIMDSQGGGVIAGLEIDSQLGLTLGDLLPEGWDFRNSDGSWLSTTELKGKTASNVTVAQLPIQSMNYPTEMSMTYGGTGTLIVNVRCTGAVTFQWYKVEDGKETAVGSAITSNQFNLAAQKLSAGKHTFRFSATCNGYKKMSQDIVVTVQKADIGSNRITPPTAQENLTYTGQAQALITAGSVTSGGTMQYSLTENGTYSPDIPVGTDAGAYTVWYRVIGDANHNDTEPASVAVSIGKKPLTITKVTAVSKPYDGTTNAGITSVTFDGVTLNRGIDYNVTASFDDAGVGNGKNITATVTLTEQTAKNYALEQSSFMTTGSITKAAAPDFTKETALVIVNGHEKTYTVTLPALTTLETPKEYGTLTYEISEIKLGGGYYTSGAKVENGKLTLPIQKNDVKTIGSVGTVTVVIKSTNYEDITLTVRVDAVNKKVPALDGELSFSKATLTYGEQLDNIKISGTMKDGNNGVTGSFAWQKPSEILAAGTHQATWIFTPTDTDAYAATTGTAAVKVGKATPTGTPIYEKITASDKTLADAKLNAIDAESKSVFSASGTKVPGTIKWVDKNGNDLINDLANIKVVQGESYKWIFTPTDHNYKELAGTIVLWAKPVSGGGGGGAAPAPTPSDADVVTIKGDNKDNTNAKPGAETGTTTTKTTVKNTTTTTTKNEQGQDVSKTTASVSKDLGDKLLDQAVSNKSDTIEITVKSNETNNNGSGAGASAADSVKATEVELPKATVNAIAKDTNADLVIKTDNGEVVLDNKTLETIAGAANGDTVTIVVGENTQLKETQKPAEKIVGKNGMLFDLVAKIGEKHLHQFEGGKAYVILPMPDKLKGKDILVIYIDDNGLCKILNHSVVKIGAEYYIRFTTPHFSTFAVVDKDEAEGLIKEQNAAHVKELMQSAKFKVTTTKTSKKSVKVQVAAKSSKTMISDIKSLGYTVKYQFYRSTKKTAGYKLLKTSSKNSFISTKGTKGRKYYYKARMLVYDGKTLVAKSALRQCSYGARTWIK